ncbi:MAG: outer membrane lipoprotein carrier protein LolA, partial [bacterium]
GKTVWTYSESNQQVIIDLLSKSEENPLPKDLLFKYAEEYVPHLVGEDKLEGKKTYVLNLVPKDKEAFIKSMKIWVDKSSWLTVKIEQIDINDNVNTYYVRNVKQNIQLETSLFTFEIPPDTEVVDLR